MANLPAVSKPVFEHHRWGTLATGHTRPRISWKFISDSNTLPAWEQTAYEIEIATGKPSPTPARFEFQSRESVLVPWPQGDLRSRERATVRVRSRGILASGTDTDESWTAWSEAATIEAGLFSPGDWSAQWITSTTKLARDEQLRPLRFYKSFTVPTHQEALSKARLYVTSLGVFDVYVNGSKASDEFMAPGWTSYKHRLGYRVLDIEPFLRSGGAPNSICIEVAEGWYAGRLAFNGGKRFCYGGEELAVLAQLELFISDAPPVRVTETIKLAKIIQSPSGKTILDFGQNLVGKLLVKSISLPAGSKVTFKHAEVLENGELGVRPLRVAKCTDIVISSGTPISNWTPKFTFHGFRYVEVEGLPISDSNPPISEDNIVALVLHTDMKRRGYFDCSNPSVNQLHKNVVWSMRGNFLSIPTDCPQRDERLGWTGDLQVFCPSASFLYNANGMIGDWLQDLALEQLAEDRGGIPGLVCPDVLPPNWPRMPQAIWDDITVLTPHDLYKYSGDTALLERQFPSMLAWLDQGVDRGSDGLWNPDRWQLGDWLDPSAPVENPGYGRTDSVMVADSYLVHVTKIFAIICGIVGKKDLSAKYTQDAESLKVRFQAKYITPAGNLMSSSQTGLALAIQFDLYQNKDQLRVASSALAKLVRSAKFHIATGFAGTPIITHALTATGNAQLAYRMLLETKCPSWLYPVTMGATTTWERWDSMLPNGTIHPGTMTSFNHYALGAVADWLHQTVGGIGPLEPGWKMIRVKPVPGGNITSARVSFDGPYGWVRCEWVLDGDGKFKMQLEVPPNTKALVVLPSDTESNTGDDEREGTIVGSGLHTFDSTFNAGQWPPNPIVGAYQKIPPQTTIAE
ncbi:hypothetical protein G7Z17_g589 [Cylindrodendrum hubeiense]|uniref:alpha-L-rhamnosidase n=1 Tax=Cylindrodendrum hubeiense TaxID=595255 RepID=A0A9P5LG64_9HYPO|nr:hypothetical protein G7Z17_g589 [Cylindrodendrum hubeiense]